MRKRSFGSYLSFLLLTLAIAALVVVPGLFYLSHLDATLVRMMEDAIQKKVVLGSIRFSLKQGIGFRLDQLSIHERDETETTILSAESVSVGLDPGALLRGQLRVRSVQGFRPRVYLVRDASGEFNLARLFSGRYLKENVPGTLQSHPLVSSLGPLLWKSRISLQEGEVHFRDEPSKDPETLSIQDLDLRTNSRLFLDRLHVELSGRFEKPCGAGSFALTGNIEHWKHARSLQDLGAGLDLSVRDVSLEAIAPYLPDKARGRKLAGTLKGSVSYDGALLLPGSAHLVIDVESPAWDNPRVHTKALTPTHVVLRATGELSREQVTSVRGELDLEGLRLGFSGGLMARGKPFSYLDLHISGQGLPLVQAKEYLPLGLLDGAVWPFLVRMTQAGTVDAQADLVGDLSDFSRMDTPQGEDALGLRLVFRDTTVLLPIPEPYLPFRAVNGTLELARGELLFRDFSARYGKAHLGRAAGHIRGIHKSSSRLDISGTVDLDLSEAVRELDHGIIPDAVREVSRKVRDASGKGTLGLRVVYSFGREAEERLEVTGKTFLKGAAAEIDACPLELTRIAGTIGFTDSSLQDLDVKLLLGSSPLRLKGQFRFGEQSEQPQGEIRWSSERLDASDVSLLLGKAKTARGSLPAQGTIRWLQDGPVWDSVLGPGNVTLSREGRAYPLTGLQADLAGAGGSLDLRKVGFELRGNRIAAKGRLRSWKPLTGDLEISSPALGLDSLLQKDQAAGPPKQLPGKGASPSPWADADLKVRLDLGRFIYRAIALERLKAHGGIVRGKLLLEDLQARHGAGEISLSGEAGPKAAGVPFSVRLSLTDIASRDVFAWLSAPSVVDAPVLITGDLRGTYDSQGRWTRTLAGDLSLESGEGVILRYDLLAKILTLVNVTQWSKVRLSDLKAQGIPLRSLRGKVHLDNGTLSTQSLDVDSSIALANLSGSYDSVRDQLRVLLSLRPMEQLDQVLDLIPVVGKVVQGPDGAIVIFYYRLEGPLKDPAVTLIPFKNLTERPWNMPLQELNWWLKSVEEALIGKWKD
ncbi:MAG: AsmA-like C-terminal region-containing protein [bacterium]